MAKALDPKVKAERARGRRNERIARLRDKGLSLKEIGETVDLTGPRVYKILKGTREYTFPKVARTSFASVS